MQDLKMLYRAYIDCLNVRDWNRLADFVSAGVRYNDEDMGLDGYQKMLVANVRDIPDLVFRVGMLIVEPPMLAARVLFACAPTSTFLGLPINGRTISFAENVHYQFGVDDKIAAVWSVIDKVAIEAQLSRAASSFKVS